MNTHVFVLKFTGRLMIGDYENLIFSTLGKAIQEAGKTDLRMIHKTRWDRINEDTYQCKTPSNEATIKKVRVI